MNLKNTDSQLALVMKVLAELYYRHAVPIDRYKKFDGWYEDAVVIDRNSIDYELWKLTGKHFGYDGVPSREDVFKS